jgi:hypothetical protein
VDTVEPFIAAHHQEGRWGAVGGGGDPSGPDMPGPLKKDGTPDMRYKENRTLYLPPGRNVDGSIDKRVTPQRKCTSTRRQDPITPKNLFGPKVKSHNTVRMATEDEHYPVWSLWWIPVRSLLLMVILALVLLVFGTVMVILDAALKMAQGCPSGQFRSWTVVDAICLPCPRGSYSSEGSATCTPCPRGTFQGMHAAGACRACPPGHFADFEGSTECTLCQKGTYQPATGGATCLACSAGHYTWGRGSLACTSELRDLGRIMWAGLLFQVMEFGRKRLP